MDGGIHRAAVGMAQHHHQPTARWPAPPCWQGMGLEHGGTGKQAHFSRRTVWRSHLHISFGFTLWENDLIDWEIDYHLHAAVDHGDEHIVHRRGEELLAQGTYRPMRKLHTMVMSTKAMTYHRI